MDAESLHVLSCVRITQTGDVGCRTATEDVKMQHARSTWPPRHLCAPQRPLRPATNDAIGSENIKRVSSDWRLVSVLANIP
jgi:hypothetical protein